MTKDPKLNLLEKIAIGTGSLGVVSVLPYFNSGESPFDSQYILGLLAVTVAGACSRLYRTK